MYRNFQNLLKNRPRFNIKYIMIECPEFIVKLVQGKNYRKKNDEISFWDDIYRKQLNLKR